MLRRAVLLLFALALSTAACSGTGPSPAASQPAASVPAASRPAATGGAPSGSGAAIAVTAVEYSFQGAPDTAAPGTSFTLVNQGRELHELLLVRKNAGVPQSFDELLKLSQADVSKFVTFLGSVMAPPGATADGVVTADVAGDYAFLCFIPQGTTALPSAGGSLPAGPPHFILGMVELLTVT